MAETTLPLPATARLELRIDRVHQIVVPGLLFAKLQLLAWEHQALDAPRCELAVDGRDRVAPSDDEARVVFPIGRANAEAEGLLTVDSEVHGYTAPRAILLGTVASVEEARGQRQRLDNLGYIPVELQADPQSPSAWAIEEFQCEHELQVDGVCGPQTQAKLVAVHGH